MESTQQLHPSTCAADRIPRGGWGRAWCIGLTASVLALALLEFDLRSRGYGPSVRDEPALWGSLRSQASGSGADTVVLLGASRFQLGIDPELLAPEMRATRVLQLSIDGSSPLPVLEDLARDDSFAGTVLVEVTPGALFGTSPRPREVAESWLAEHEKRPLLRDLEVALRLPLEERFAILRPGLKTALVDRLLARASSAPHVSMRRSRYQPADFTRRDQHGSRSTPSLGSELCEHRELGERLETIRVAVAEIRRRGGRVVFVRMPSTGEVRAHEDLVFPREVTWDRLVATDGVVGIHFEDDAELSSFECPDGSHLDTSDVARFTSLLASRLSSSEPERIPGPSTSGE